MPYRTVIWFLILMIIYPKVPRTREDKRTKGNVAVKVAIGIDVSMTRSTD